MDAEAKPVDAKAMMLLKHDIKNQLSNIVMLIDQLKHEMQNSPAEQLDYLDMIQMSATKIDSILKTTD